MDVLEKNHQRVAGDTFGAFLYSGTKNRVGITTHFPPSTKIPCRSETSRNSYRSPFLNLCRAKISLSVHLSRTGLSHRPGHISPATPDAQSLTTTDDNRIDRPLGLGALSSWPIVAKRVLLLLLLPGTQQL